MSRIGGTATVTEQLFIGNEEDVQGTATLMEQLFIGNKEDEPLRAFYMVFSMHVVVTRSPIQVTTSLLVCSVSLLVCSVMVRLL
jgi:hypothetical protein